MCLLQPLQSYTSCCSNLTWLLAQIKSTAKTLTVASITGIGLDIDRNRLGTVGSYILRHVLPDSVTCLNLSTNLPTYSQPITYHQNLYYVGIFPAYKSKFYITDGSMNGSVWRLQTSSPYNFTLFIPGSSSKDSPTVVTVDNCNRLWVIFYGYGIRIYNISTAAILTTWNLTATYPQLCDLVLTNQYQLYLGDKSVSKSVRYGSVLQCTN